MLAGFYVMHYKNLKLAQQHDIDTLSCHIREYNC